LEEKMKRVNHRLALIVAVMALAALACTQLTVTNESNWQLRVAVTLPGSSRPDVHVYERGESHDYYPDSAGSYKITIYPGEDYIEVMNNLKFKVQDFLLEPDIWSPDQIVHLVSDMNNIDKILADLQGKSCTGTLVEDGTVTAKLNINVSGEYSLECP
jgi:hypothetical protein